VLRLLIPFRREFFSGASDHARSNGLRKFIPLKSALHKKSRNCTAGRKSFRRVRTGNRCLGGHSSTKRRPI